MLGRDLAVARLNGAAQVDRGVAKSACRLTKLAAQLPQFGVKALQFAIVSPLIALAHRLGDRRSASAVSA